MGEVELVTKQCRDCGETKPVSQFYKDSGREADGYRRRCSQCDKDLSAAMRERFIAEHGIDAWKERQRAAQAKHRATPEGRAKAREATRRRHAVVKILIARHRAEYDHLMLLARRGELPDA